MKIVLKNRPKPNQRRRSKSKRSGKVFRILKRLDNGDLMLFGFVSRYKKSTAEAPAEQIDMLPLDRAS